MKQKEAKWTADAQKLRDENKEIKSSFQAQGKLLADATNQVFQLETKIKESAHKLDRLHDYERQIEQLIKMQKLWESDVTELNQMTEYLKEFNSNYKKMEVRLETYEKIQESMNEDAKRDQRQIQLLESRLSLAQKQLSLARRAPSTAELISYQERAKELSAINERLRNENHELRMDAEEQTAMIHSLRMGHTSGTSQSPTSSPVIPSASFNMGL